MNNSYFDGKTILITGGLGFIGSNLAIMLSALNPKKIIIVDSLVEGLGGDINNISEIKNKEILEVYSGLDCDIKHVEKMKNLIGRSDVIFNLAGSVKHTRFFENELMFDTNTNFISQVFFMEACRQVMVENPQKKLRVVFAGTRDQYGKVPFEDLPVTEEYLPKKVTDYQSVSKNAAELHHEIINDTLNELGIDIKISSVRMTNVYGPRQSAKVGSAVAVFVDKSMKGEIIELWGGGDSLRDFNYVDDVIDALFVIASSDVTGVFNLGCCIGKEGMKNPIKGNLVTIKELAEKIVNISGKGSIKVIPYPAERKAIEPGHFAADISKISKLGWQPKTSLEEGLRKTIEFELSRIAKLP